MLNEIMLILFLFVPQIIYFLSTIFSAIRDRNQNFRMVAAYLSLISILMTFSYLVVQFYNSNTRYKLIATTISDDMNVQHRIFSVWSGSAGTLFVWVTFLVLVQLSAEYFSDSYQSNIAPVIVSSFTTAILIGLLFERPFEMYSQRVDPSFGIPPTLRSYYIGFHPLLSFAAYSLSLYLYAIFVSDVDLSRSMLRKLHGVNLLIVALISSAMVSGAFWSNEVLWGGHWTWDPVENLSLLIFLLALLPIHLRSFSPSTQLAAMGSSFPGILFSTFVIRSGLLKDPHSYASSSQIIFFLVLFLISLFPYLRLASLPNEIQLNLTLANQGRYIWVLITVVLILVLTLSTIDLLVYAYLSDEQVATPKVFYQLIVLPLLIFPLILTLFLEFLEIVNLKKVWINFIFASIIILLLVGILSISKALSIQVVYLVVILLLPVILINFLTRSFLPQHLRLKKSRIIRIPVHFLFLVLLLSFYSTYASTVYEDISMEQNKSISIYSEKITIRDIHYSSNLGDQIYPWDRPFNLTWEIGVIVQINQKQVKLKSGWNPVHEFYTTAATINTLLTTLQIILKFDVFAPFIIEENNQIVLNIQVRKMFNGYLLHGLELLFPISTFIPVVVYLRNSELIDDYYK